MTLDNYRHHVKEYFDPLAENHNVLPGEHAYSHVNAFSSAMQAYLVLGDERYLRAATNGFRMVQEQSYATGGWGPDEAFVEPGQGLLDASLSTTHSSFETPCGAYGHFKITRYLLRVTRDSRYGDSMERILYNTIGGATPILADGTSFYYSDYNNAGKKVHYKDKWPCCSGTLPQVVADYTISAYFPAPEGVYVNLYVPSRLSWNHNSVRCVIRQETEYPISSLVTMRIEPSSPIEFSINLRIPAWAGGLTSVSVNGKRLKEVPSPGTFFALRRTWKSGDIVELDLDQAVRKEPVDAQNTNQVALIRGPQVLFAISDRQPELTLGQLEKPKLSKAGGNDWTLDLGHSSILLRPFSSIGGEVYQTYWKVNAASS